MLLLPYRTDAPIRRTPTVNYVLIGLNVAVFVVQKMLGDARSDELFKPYMLWPGAPKVVQFVSYQFLHGDILHLAGNMLFLWVFGNSVNAKMGNLAYALFYLACGVFAGVGFVFAEGGHPCVGASGAIAGVTTAYLVLFPRTDVTVLYWVVIFIGTTAIRSIWLILIKMVLWDNFISMYIERGDGFTSVAYSAHIAGYLAGFVLTLTMLWLKALPRDHFDLLSIWRRANQRREFASMMADPNARSQAQYGRVARPAGAAAVVLARPVDPMAGMRDAVIAALSSADPTGAMDRYAELISKDPEQGLPPRFQLEIGNQFMASQRYGQAAAAYETFLRHYSTAANANEVKLLLGILYARYVPQYERARSFLVECVEKLTSPAQRAQASQWLAEVSRALGGGAAGATPST